MIRNALRAIEYGVACAIVISVLAIWSLIGGDPYDADDE